MGFRTPPFRLRGGDALVGLIVGAGIVAVGASLAEASRLAFPEEQPIEIIASKEGFSPSTLRLKRGETVRLELTTADGEHCFAIDALRVEKRIVPGRPTRLELTPDRAGVFHYYCCLEPPDVATTQRGRLDVTE
jgi:heme/copper-type cytochrome/quinol oxidase subunit 2